LCFSTGRSLPGIHGVHCRDLIICWRRKRRLPHNSGCAWIAGGVPSISNEAGASWVSNRCRRRGITCEACGARVGNSPGGYSRDIGGCSGRGCTSTPPRTRSRGWVRCEARRRRGSCGCAWVGGEAGSPRIGSTGGSGSVLTLRISLLGISLLGISLLRDSLLSWSICVGARKALGSRQIVGWRGGIEAVCARGVGSLTVLTCRCIARLVTRLNSLPSISVACLGTTISIASLGCPITSQHDGHLLAHLIANSRSRIAPGSAWPLLTSRVA